MLRDDEPIIAHLKTFNFKIWPMLFKKKRFFKSIGHSPRANDQILKIDGKFQWIVPKYHTRVRFQIF